MKERPILYSTDMVSATLDNRPPDGRAGKNQTRRTRGLDLINKHPDDWQCFGIEIDPELVPHDEDLDDAKECKGLYAHFEHNGDPESWPGFDHTSIKCPYGQPGDLLYVREKWQHNRDFMSRHRMPYVFPDLVPNWDIKWKPSIHMPKEAARIWLKITSIRPERVQDISEEDIKAEGVQIPVNGIGTGKVLFELGQKNKAIDFLPDGCFAKGAPKLTQYQILKAFWAELWCKINGRESYDLNPWVWAIGFEVLSTTGRPDKLIKSLKAQPIN